jgi:hypothetical protein
MYSLIECVIALVTIILAVICIPAPPLRQMCNIYLHTHTHTHTKVSHEEYLRLRKTPGFEESFGDEVWISKVCQNY